MDQDHKNLLTEIAKGYNDDLEMEKLHRGNLLRHLFVSSIWIAVTLGAVWFEVIRDFLSGEGDSIWITIWGVMLITLNLLSCYTINKRYKTKVKLILNARQSCLQIRDNDIDIGL